MQKSLILMVLAGMILIGLFPRYVFAQTEPTFLVFKYQHIVGKETDICGSDESGKTCHAHFQLDFTGSSIALDADIRVDRAYRPVSFTAKGQNSTRSFMDLSVIIREKE